jgi:hypothetical protein
VDIIITRDDFHTLANIVIANLTYIDLVQHASTMIVHAATVEIKTRHDFI